MKVDIKVLSRETIEKEIRQGERFANRLIISFCDEDIEPVDFSLVSGEVIVCKVDDIAYDELEEAGYTYQQFLPQAEQIAVAIDKMVKQDMSIICQCEYGESRSAGCAAAVLEYYEHRGIDLFVDYERCPSRLIYHKIYDMLLQVGEEQ